MAQPIAFGSAQRSGLEELAGGGVVAMNVFTDSTGAVRRRPGIVAYAEAPTEAVDADGISGVFAMDDGKILAVGAGTKRWVYEVAAGSTRRLSEPLPGLGRPTFAQTEMLVVMAGGGGMLKYVRSDGSVSLLGGSPPLATHVAASNLRLLGNDGVLDRTKIRFSDISQGTLSYAGHETWTPTTPPTAGYFTAEAKPDPVAAIGESNNEIFVWGTQSLQVFSPDPTFIFSPVASREIGIAAPYSVTKSDQQFFWLDHLRRFVMGDGRNFNVVSQDLKRTLEQIDTVDDCFGYRVLTGSLDAMAFTLPTDGRTFVFQKGSGWAQWSAFGANWARFPVNAHTFRRDDGANVVGLTDGRVAKLSLDATTDLGDPINAYTVTGYENRDTDMKKHCQCVRLTLRRGSTTSSTGPVGFLSWRDKPGPWEPRIPVRLGRSNDTHPVLEFRSLGTYRRRQWMFEFSGTEDLALISASEDFEVSDQ